MEVLGYVTPVLGKVCPSGKPSAAELVTRTTMFHSLDRLLFMTWENPIHLFYLWKGIVMDTAQYFTMSQKWLSDFFNCCFFNQMGNAEHTTASVCLIPLCARNLKATFVTYLLYWLRTSTCFPNSRATITNILTFIIHFTALHVFLKATLFLEEGRYKWSKQKSICHLFP